MARSAVGVSERTPIKLGARCNDCPLQGSQWVLGEGPLNAKLAVVGEAPGRDEVKTGHPFIGQSGKALETFLEKKGLVRSQVWIDNAISCFPPGGDYDLFVKASKKEYAEKGLEWYSPIDCCRTRLFRELNIPRCRKCSKWQTGPEGMTCSCKKTELAYWRAGEGPISVLPAGNVALESLVGVWGILKWRGSPLDVVKRARGGKSAG